MLQFHILSELEVPSSPDHLTNLEMLFMARTLTFKPLFIHCGYVLGLSIPAVDGKMNNILMNL